MTSIFVLLDGTFLSYNLQASVKQHNKLRKEHGAKKLEWSEECAKHARKWAIHLMEIDSLAHDDTG